MPQAERDLSDLLSHGHIAGRDQAAIVAILREVATHLRYLHEDCNRIHGDLKPRNIVKVRKITGEISWVLIDLDASCELGKSAGDKVPSSACYPPEMAQC